MRWSHRSAGQAEETRMQLLDTVLDAHAHALVVADHSVDAPF
jgi:hypothetical protein